MRKLGQDSHSGTHVVRIGLITPSSNTVLEPVVHRLLRHVPEVSVHVSRVPVTAISLDAAADDQFATEPMTTAAEQLRDARVDVVAWAGTAGSWLGVDRDAKLCAHLTAVTGIPTTTSTLALLHTFRRLGIDRLGLVTPYVAEVSRGIAARYADEGVRVLAEQHLDLTDNWSFGDVAEQRIRAMIETVAAHAPAVAVVCTNLRATFVAAECARLLGIPVIDSIAATLRHTLRITHEPDPRQRRPPQ